MTHVINLSNENPTLIYAFRAEYPKDVEQFLNAIKLVSLPIDACMTIYATTQFPERHVELYTVLNLEALRQILRGMPDSHLMIQTLRPGKMADGSLSRDFSIF